MHSNSKLSPPPALRGPFVGARLQLAREFHGLTQIGLGQEVAASAATVSNCENGVQRNPSDDLVAAYSERLGFVGDFFYRPLLDGFLEEECHFRHRRSTPERVKKQIRAHATLLGEVLHHLRKTIRLPDFAVPSLGASDPEGAADECRRVWGIDRDAPLLTIARALERAGVVIVNHVGETAKVDAFSRRGPVTVIFLNRSAQSASRLAFDIAHETAHLVMHDGIVTGCLQTEAQANRFASAFLLPRRAFSREFRAAAFTWSHVFQLKVRWQVSAAAIVRRAYDLSLLSAIQYRRSFQHMSAHGWTKAEPHEPEFQEPELLEAALRAAHQHAGETLGSMGSVLGYRMTTLARILGTTIPKTTTSEKVIDFRGGERERERLDESRPQSGNSGAIRRGRWSPASNLTGQYRASLGESEYPESTPSGQAPQRSVRKSVMAKKPRDVHVSTNDGARPWKVTQGGETISTHQTQANAIDRGKTEARRDQVDLVTHGRDGKIRSKDSYGNETSVRDTEH